MLPKISIVTPSFNQGKFIEQTILSVINQKYFNIEYIIIDGGSTDGTIDIIKKYEKYIAYWVSEPDKGQSDAINKGFKKVTGDIFNWLNSDDYLEPGALFKIAEAFLNGATCIAGFVRNFIDVHSSQDWLERTKLFSSISETAARSANRQPGTFFSTEHIKDFFPLPSPLHYTMDQYLWVSYILKYGIKKAIIKPDCFVNFRWHQDSKTQSNNKRYALTYSEPFFNDLNSVYYNLCHQYNLHIESQILSLYFSKKYEGCNFSFTLPTSIYPLVKKTIHFFLLELAFDDYFKKEFNRLSKNLLVISSTELNTTSKIRLNFLKVKTLIQKQYLKFKKIFNTPK